MVKAVPDLSLAAAFRQVELVEIGRDRSVAVYQGRRHGIDHLELHDPGHGGQGVAATDAGRGTGPLHLVSVFVDWA